MSGSASISLEQAILGHTLGFAQMVFPSQVYVALCSAAMPPSETVQGIEAFGGGYTRMRATFALIDTPSNVAANTASIEWPVASASWGTLGYFELWDAATGGNRLYWGQFSPPDPVTVSAGDIVRFSAGTLGVQASSGSGGTTSIGAYLPLAGGSMGGSLLLSHDPATYLEAATKQYVDAHSGTGGGPGFLPLSGGTMLGSLTLAGNATAALQAVPWQQVSGTVAVNVKNYGAVGDGTTNDAPAFMNALAAIANGGRIVVPVGTYAIGSALTQAITGAVTLEGAGSDVTILSFSAATDGLTFSLAPSANVHVRGLTIVRTAASPAYANTGLSLVTPLTQTGQRAPSSIQDVTLRGNTARTTAWATGINISNLNSVALDHVMVAAPDATGTGPGVGVSYAGLSTSSYGVEAAFNDVTVQGGRVGLAIGDWVQGVYVVNSRFIGTDYGINWPGVVGHADITLFVSNTHFNCTTRGVFASNGGDYHIVNTLTLHFGTTSVTGDWAAIEITGSNSGMLANNNVEVVAGFAGTENGIKLSSGAWCTVIGNIINGTKNTGIVLNTMTDTTIIGNIGVLQAGAVLITDTPYSQSNQKLINQNNGGYDISTDAGGRIALGVGLVFNALPANAANDAAAATAGVPLQGVYRNGSVLQIRIV